MKIMESINSVEITADSEIEMANKCDHNESTETCYTNENVMLSWWVNSVVNILQGFWKEKRSFGDMMGSNGRWYDRFVQWTQGLYSGSDHGEGKVSGPLLAGAAYSLSSSSMILLNKVALSTFNFDAGISLMFYQNLISTIIVGLLGFFGLVSLEKLNFKLIGIWIPVNIIFVGMLVSGMYSLKYINIAMVTVLKNVTNIITAIGELYIFGKHQNQRVWTAMFLMIISAITGGITDLSFDPTGYTWQILNCILTAGYSLTLRRVMDKAKQATKSGSLNEVSMVLLNNSLSLPFAMVLILTFGEWDYVKNTDVLTIPMFWVVATFSGLLGLTVSFTSMWFLNQTSPTTYSLVGSLNKIPISIAGILLFNVPLSLTNSFSILFGNEIPISIVVGMFCISPVINSVAYLSKCVVRGYLPECSLPGPRCPRSL